MIGDPQKSNESLFRSATLNKDEFNPNEQRRVETDRNPRPRTVKTMEEPMGATEGTNDETIGLGTKVNENVGSECVWEPNETRNKNEPDEVTFGTLKINDEEV